MIKRMVNRVKGIASLISEGNDPRYLVNLVRSKVHAHHQPQGLNLKIMSPKETLNAILKSGKSFIRWGDADARLVLRGNIYYQTATNQMRKELIEMLTDYDKKSPYILCLPSKVNLHNKDMTAKERETYDICKKVLRKYAKINQVYGDHLMFYSMVLKHKDIAKLWKNAQNLIIVHFDKEVFRKFSKINKGKKMFFIQVPVKNTFFEKKRVISEIKEIYDKNKLDNKKTKILLSAGTGARAIIKTISEEGYVAYDMGTYFGLTKDEVKNYKDLNLKQKHMLFPSR